MYLCAAFTPVAPQSVRTQSSCQYLFTILRSTSVKPVRRMLMKLSPCVACHLKYTAVIARNHTQTVITNLQ